MFSLGVYAAPGLLALQGLGVSPFSFFLRPLLFCFFLIQIPWLCCAFVVVPAGVFFSPVAFLPWPAFLSLGPRVS